VRQTTDVGRLVMTIMGGIAEFERSLIRKRCEEGIQRARRKGTKFGRSTALNVGQCRRIAERYAGRSAGLAVSKPSRRCSQHDRPALLEAQTLPLTSRRTPSGPHFTPSIMKSLVQ